MTIAGAIMDKLVIAGRCALEEGTPSAPQLNTRARQIVYRITSTDCPQFEQLAPVWLALQERAMQQGAVSFFTSWMWIGSWLATLDKRSRPTLWQARDADGRLAGLAIVVVRRKWRFGVIPFKVGYLHETGLSDCDEITIEYNGVLASEGERSGVTSAMVCAMMAAGIDQLYLSGILEVPVLEDNDFHVEDITKPAYQIDLQGITATGSDYLSSLKQRSRYLVRKSLKRLTESAPLHVEEATTLAQAQAYQTELIRLHTRYWSGKGEPGAFQSPFQRAFHARLLEWGFPGADVVMLAILHGGHSIGFFYFFCQGGWAHYYQSGIDYDRYEASDSPGLAAHAVAAEYFRARGLAVYDFMAGDVQYKRTLATRTSELHWATVSRRNWRLRLVNRLRQLGRAARGRLARRRNVVAGAVASTLSAAPESDR